MSPVMVIAENMLLGHFLEAVKVRRQVTGVPYTVAARSVFRTTGWLGGYWPYGVIQGVTKGLPILYTRRTMLRAMGYDPYSTARPPMGSSALAGACAGAAQALVVTPTQRMKTRIWSAAGGAGKRAARSVRPFRGLTSMLCRRSVDWGVRSASVDAAKNPAVGAVVGTLVGMAFTMPFDNAVAWTQSDKPGLPPLRALYRGWCVRVLDASHHTFWVLVVGSWVLRQLVVCDGIPDL